MNKLTTTNIKYLIAINQLYNKQNGVRCTDLANMLGVLPEEMVAVGDGINDYPMFEFAGTALGVNVKEPDKVNVNFNSIFEVLEYIQGLV